MQPNNLEYKLQLWLDWYSSSVELQWNTQRVDGYQRNLKNKFAISKTGLWLKYRLIPLTFPQSWEIYRTGRLHLPSHPVLQVACSRTRCRKQSVRSQWVLYYSVKHGGSQTSRYILLGLTALWIIPGTLNTVDESHDAETLERNGTVKGCNER